MPPKITFASTNIAALDAQLEEIGKMPIKAAERETTLPAKFPGRSFRVTRSGAPAGRAMLPGLTKRAVADVQVEGAGWNFPIVLTALIASGNTVEALEMNPHKIAMGQVGLTDADEYFPLGLHKHAQLMPDFTPEQLQRLHPIIEAITQLPAHKALAEKRRLADSLQASEGSWKERSESYQRLDESRRISKRERVHLGIDMINLAKSWDMLKINPREADIDDVSSRLDAGRAVFMATGEQVDLEKMGMLHLKGLPGFVEEFLPGHPGTESALNIILDKQRKVKEWAAKEGVAIEDVPIDMLPVVAVVGGGASSRNNIRGILHRVDPELLVLKIVRPFPKDKAPTPSKALEAAKSAMDFQSTSGYVSGMRRSKDGTRIDAMSIFNTRTNEIEEIAPDLIVHTVDERFSTNERAEPYEDASDSMTEDLEDDPATNALLRFRTLIPTTDERADLEIRRRISEPFEISLRQDKDMVDAIQALIGKHDDGLSPSIVMTGENLLTRCVTLLANELGYRGRLIQLAAPEFPDERTQQNTLLEDLDGVRQPELVEGRLKGDGTEHIDGRFRLAIEDPDGIRTFTPGVDVLVNATGKTKSIKLVRAMKGRNHIGTHPYFQGEMDLHSNHPKLDGWNNFFSEDSGHVVDADHESPSFVLAPLAKPNRLVPPWGWEKTFNFGAANQEPGKRHSLLGSRGTMAGISSGVTVLEAGFNAPGEIPASGPAAGGTVRTRLEALRLMADRAHDEEDPASPT